MADINEVRQQIASLQQQLDVASSQQWDCDQQLRPLGARKKNKPPEVLAQIQAEIDRLRATKQEAIAIQKDLEPQLKKLRNEILPKLERVEKLNQQQAERDRIAAIQNNGHGKHPGKGKDISWRI